MDSLRSVQNDHYASAIQIHFRGPEVHAWNPISIHNKRFLSCDEFYSSPWRTLFVKFRHEDTRFLSQTLEGPFSAVSTPIFAIKSSISQSMRRLDLFENGNEKRLRHPRPTVVRFLSVFDSEKVHFPVKNVYVSFENCVFQQCFQKLQNIGAF